jgi:NAD(P)H dehydrogenase (quinone)
LWPLCRTLQSGDEWAGEDAISCVELNRAPIGDYADRLLAAEALVLIYPVWNEGFPAILKGFFDRVFIPGVSFNVGPDGAIVPNLQKLRKLAAVCTYGATRTISFLLGDPPKRVVKRLVRSMPGHTVRCDYLAHYDMDHSTPEQRVAFLQKVRRTFETWWELTARALRGNSCASALRMY